MDGNPTKYFWAEPDGGADLRLSLPLDCFWEALDTTAGSRSASPKRGRRSGV